MTTEPRDRAAKVEGDLIYDLGMHEGQDTEFYLKKGFRVVAVDANARLCEQVAARLKLAVDSGALTILNTAVAPEPGEVTFYDNENTHWGTIDPRWAARNVRFGAQSTMRSVPATTVASIIAEHGVPYFMKVDIEGMDLVAVEGLQETETHPTYLSIESDKTSFVALRREFEVLDDLGYDRFKLVSQLAVPKQKLPEPSREGTYVEYAFVGGASGAFGEEAPGHWMSAEEAIEGYRRVFLQYALTGDDPFVRSPRVRFALRALGFHADWYDTHAKHRDAT